MLYDDGTSRGFLRNSRTGWIPDTAHAPPLPIDDRTQLLDVDGDGIPELVYVAAPAGGAPTWRVYRFTGGGWTEILDPAFRPPFSASLPVEAVRALDLNGDGVADLIVSSAKDNIHQAYLASSTGWKPAPAGFNPPFDLVDAGGISSGAIVADLDGDGRLDIAARRKTKGGEVSFAYLQTAAGWVAATALVPPAPLNSGDNPAKAVGVFVGDLDGDGRADIAIPGADAHAFGTIYQGTTAGFVQNFGYLPPVSFSRKDQQDRGLRIVDLNGDGLPDMLYSRESLVNGTVTKEEGALINTGHGWVPTPGLIPPKSFASDTITGNPVEFADVDGDGFVDMLYSYRKSDGSVDVAYFHNESDGAGGRRWVAKPTSDRFTPPSAYPFAAQGEGDLGVRIVDLNGDGRPDLIVGAMGAKTGDTAKDSIETCQQVGKCVLNRQRFNGMAWLNDGAGWAPAPAFGPPLPFVSLVKGAGQPSDDLAIQLVDVDGDNLPDLVAWFKHPDDATRDVRETWTNTGAGWRAEASILAPTPLDAARTDGHIQLQWIDLNGDGLLDLVMSDRSGPSNLSKTWISTGRGFTETAAWQLPLEVMADRAGDPGFRILDVNGDGFPDLIYARATASGVERGLYTNTASGWVKGDPALVAALPALVDADNVDQGVRPVDVDGNGLPDFIQSFDASNSGAAFTSNVLLNTGRRSAVLLGIDSGYGATIAVAYQSMMERPIPGAGSPLWQHVYEPGQLPTYPTVAAVPASYVVARAVSDDGAGRITALSYRYGSYRLDGRAMRSLGFGWREAFNERTSVLSRSEFDQDVRGPGRSDREAVCWLNLAQRPAGDMAPRDNYCPGSGIPSWIAPLSETTQTWSVREMQIGGMAVGGALRQTTLKGTAIKHFELDGKVISSDLTQFVYDEPANLLDRHENVLQSKTTRIDGTSLEVDNIYQDDTDNWYLGRLVAATSHKVGDIIPGAAGQRHVEDRTSAFSYFANTGLLASETMQPGDPLYLTTTYVRDRYGNITSSRKTAAGEQARGVDVDFDAVGRFPVRRTNILGQTSSQTTDIATGMVLSSTDANNLTANFTYDDTGRLISETSPTGVVTKIEFLAASDVADKHALDGLAAAYAVRKTVGDMAPSLDVFDGQGRLLRSVVDGFSIDDHAYRPVQRDLRYDADGRPAASSIAYDRGSKPTFAQLGYDILGRVVQETSASGATTLLSYKGRDGGGGFVTTTDALNHSSTVETNARGLQLNVTDAKGNIVSFLDYDASDHALLVRLPTGSLIRHGYDGFGRLVTLADPNFGQRTYTYNAFGELRTQTDGPHTTIITRDALGRVSTTVANGTTYAYDYVVAGYGEGNVSSVADGFQYKKTYAYDQFGRPAASTVSIGSENFTTSLQLDQYGRPVLTALPTPNGLAPVQVRNQYDRKGYLTQVTSPNGSKTYWQVTSMTASGEVASDLLGNNLVEDRTFDPTTLALTRQRVHSLSAGPGAGAVMDLKLDYDGVGNLTQRQETTSAIAEKFAYDELDRLTKMTHADKSSEIYKFDALGRLTFKTGVGPYSYRQLGAPGVWHPADGPSSVGVGPTKQALTYDQVTGNLIQIGNETLSYTDDNRLQRVQTDPYHHSDFEYDPDGARYRQVSVSGAVTTETLYIGGYERTTRVTLAAPFTSSIVRHRYYLSNGSGIFGSIDILVRNPVPGAALAPSTRTETWYLHSDQLGSVLRITDEQGRVAGRYWYDPWGKQVMAQEQIPPGDLGPSWSRAFEGHEYLEGLSLIHMNGRVYDSRLGIFTSPDPVGEEFAKTQSFNRFGYALGNPLRYVDPTGYWGLGDLWHDVTHAVGDAVHAVGNAVGDAAHWVGQHWREVVIVAVAVAVTYFTAGAGAGIGDAMLAGMAGGAASGATAAALYGGNLSDDIEAAVQGGVWGAVTAGAFSGAGAVSEAGGFENSLGSVALHGAVGGTVAVAQGGNFWTGAESAAVAEAVNVYTPSFGSDEANLARAALVGGTVSELTGGNFVNGAVTSAAAYLFNNLGDHGNMVDALKGNEVRTEASSWEDTPYDTTGLEEKGKEGGADCSHSTHAIFHACGIDYPYTRSEDFAKAANDSNFPFKLLGANDNHQPGDLILFKGHMAIYAGQENGQDVMWTAHNKNHQTPYNEQQMRYWPKPTGWYRAQIQK